MMTSEVSSTIWTVTRRRHSQTNELSTRRKRSGHNLKSSLWTLVSITVTEVQWWISTTVIASRWTHFKRSHKSWRMKEFKNKRLRTKRPWWITWKPRTFPKIPRSILSGASTQTRQISSHFNLKLTKWSEMPKMRSSPIIKQSSPQMWRDQSSQTQTRMRSFVDWMPRMSTSTACDVTWMWWWQNWLKHSVVKIVMNLRSIWRPKDCHQKIKRWFSIGLMWITRLLWQISNKKRMPSWRHASNKRETPIQAYSQITGNDLVSPTKK